MAERRPIPPARGESETLPIQAESGNVPAFQCIVYLRDEDATVRGRVANLAGIECQGTDQRAVLGQIVASFKAAVAACLQDGNSPAWIDPPEPKRDDERKVFLPVHL